MNTGSLLNAARLIAAGNLNGDVMAVAVDWQAGGAMLTVAYYTDGPPTDNARELCELTAGELIAQFPDIASARTACLDGRGQAAALARLDGLVHHANAGLALAARLARIGPMRPAWNAALDRWVNEDGILVTLLFRDLGAGLVANLDAFTPAQRAQWLDTIESAITTGPQAVGDAVATGFLEALHRHATRAGRWADIAPLLGRASAAYLEAWFNLPPAPSSPAPACLELAVHDIFRLADGTTVLACAAAPRGLPCLPAMATLCEAGQPRQAILLQSRRPLGRPRARAGECALDTHDAVRVSPRQLREGVWTLRLRG